MRQEPHRLIFIDETAVKINLTRLRGRAPVRERLYGTAPFGKWGRQTFIAGLTQNVLIEPWVITGAMNGPAFDTYIETQLVPELEPGTVVILDNLSTHKSPPPSNRCDGEVVGSCFCPPTVPTTIQSSWHLPRHPSDGSALEPLTLYLRRSPTSADCSNPKSA